MARFYQTSDPNFVDDFIFQPNWDLAALAIDRKNQEMQDASQTLDLFGQLPVEFHDVDKESVKEYLEANNQKIQDIISNIDPMNMSVTNRAIGDLRREIQTDMQTGKIYDWAKHKENIEKYMEGAKGLSDDPYWQEQYLKKFQEYEDKAKGRGLESGAFEGVDAFYTDKGLKLDKLATSDIFAKLGVNSDMTNITTERGRHYVTENNKTTEITVDKIEAAYKQYVEENRDNLGLALADRDFLHLGLGLLDENGNLDWSEGSVLYNNMKEAGKLFHGLNKEYTESLKETERAKDNRDFAIWKKKKDFENPLDFTQSSALGAWETSSEVRAYKQEQYLMLAESWYRTYLEIPNGEEVEASHLVSFMGARGITDFDSFVEYVEKNPNIDARIKASVIATKNDLEQRLVAGYAYLQQYGISQNNIKNLSKDLNTVLSGDGPKANTAEWTFTQDLKTITNEYGRIDVEKTQRESNERWTTKGLEGSNYNDARTGKTFRIEKVEILNGVEPVIFNGEDDPNKLNLVKGTARIWYYEYPESTQSANSVLPSFWYLQSTEKYYEDYEDDEEIKPMLRFIDREATTPMWQTGITLDNYKNK